MHTLGLDFAVHNSRYAGVKLTHCIKLDPWFVVQEFPAQRID